MSKKKKEKENIILYGKLNITNLKEDLEDFPKDNKNKFKINQFTNIYFILFILYLFLPLLTLKKINPKEFLLFNTPLDIYTFKSFPLLSMNSYINRFFPLSTLSKIFDFYYLYFY